MDMGSAAASGLATGAGVASARVARRSVVVAVKCIMVMFKVIVWQLCLEMCKRKDGVGFGLGVYTLVTVSRMTGNNESLE